MMGRKEKTDQQKSTLKRGKQNWLRYEMDLETKQESSNSINAKWGKIMNKNG